MQGRTTFFLLVLVILLGAFVAVTEWGAGREGELQRPRPARLLDLEPEHVDFWSFYRDGLYCECVREQGQWLLRKPVQARANAVKINHMLGVMTALPRQEIVTAAQRDSRALSLSDYGLLKPAARMALGAAARRHTLNIGVESPMQDAVYVQLDGADAVIATATNLLDVMPRAADDLRDPRLVPGSPANVKGLELKSRGRPLVRIVREGPEWIIHKPITARADWERISALLDRIFALEAQRFVADRLADPDAFGLGDDEALLLIHLWQDEESNGQTLCFGDRAGGPDDPILAVSRGEGTVMTVRRDTVEALNVTLESVRDARLYFMNAEKIGWIQIEDDERRLRLWKQDAAGWLIMAPVQCKADNRAVGDLVNRLNALRIEAFLNATNLAALGLDPPARVVRVAETPPSAEEQNGVAAGGRALALSRTQPGREFLYAKFEDEDQVCQISVAAAAALSADPLHYRDNVALALDPAAVTRIAQRRGTREQMAARAGAAQWTAVTPPSGRVRLEVVRAMLDHLSALRVLRYERPERGDLGVYGLKEPRSSVTFGLSGQAGIQKTLMLGDESEDLGVYAMVQGQDVICVLPRAAADAFLAEIIW